MNLKSVDLRNEIFHIRIQIFITLLMVIESLLNYIITKIDIIIYVILRFIEDCLRGANSLHESIQDIMPYKRRNNIFKDKYFKLDENQICKTITSHMKYDCNMYIHPWEARGLSPREAARIQTFPDDFILKGAQNSWYAQVGNAVPVKFAEVIGRSIMKFL